MSEQRLTGSSVAEVMGGALVSGDGKREFAGVSIDTRTIQTGELFVAIRGERFDGGDFAEAALNAGAGGVVVARGRGRGAGRGSAVVIEVDDTLVALQTLAHRVRQASGARVVAITGSAGKTTTKEVTAEFLSTRYRVMRNRGNLNNHIGLPLSLMELRSGPDIAVVELGMSHAGEISRLVRMAEPDVRVWTNVGEAHLEFFGSVDDIADAKAEILEEATTSMILVANADDERVVTRASSFAGKVVTFGIERPADVRASRVVDRGIGGTSSRVTTPHGTLDLAIPLAGRGNLSNVLAATAVAVHFDVPLEAIAERATRLQPAGRRGQVVRLSAITVIDDSYNANPAAMRTALQILAGETSASRRVAVLGEMLELGSHAMALHEDIGRAAFASGVDVLVAVGGALASALARSAVTAGMRTSAVHHFQTSESAAAAVAAIVRPGDVVLVKGSRSVRTDRVVDRLKAEHA